MIRPLATLVLLGSASPVVAGPDISEKISYYTVAGSSLPELRREMFLNGPDGFWAYTSWWVSWDATCRVDARVSIEMPRLATPEHLTAAEYNTWQSMLVSLLAHERKHGANGISAAKEIAAASCVDAQQIIRKWNQKDRILDQRTDHGAREGVELD